MRKVLCILGLIASFNLCIAQGDTLQSENEVQEVINYQEIEYIDSTLKYSVRLPHWITLMEPGKSNSFGGKLPAVDGIENAILVTGFTKEKFKDFESFKEIYLTGNKFGQPVKWGSGHGWMGQNELLEIENGVKQKVFLFWENHVYHSQFVLLESESSFLWIQFMSTPETYDKNIDKFDEFMDGFELMN